MLKSTYIEKIICDIKESAGYIIPEAARYLPVGGLVIQSLYHEKLELTRHNMYPSYPVGIKQFNRFLRFLSLRSSLDHKRSFIIIRYYPLTLDNIILSIENIKHISTKIFFFFKYRSLL